MENALNVGVHLSPGSILDGASTSFRGPWEIDFERIFRLRNHENPDFPIAMTLPNAPNPTHFYFRGVKFGDFSWKICDFS